MSTDALSPADQDELVKTVSPIALECGTCGRDCKHIPTAPGGGTAGSERGTRWQETDRSRARCPACHQKPHRKEGRPHQVTMCQMAQAALALGLTTVPMPSAVVHRKAVELLEAGLMRETPTDRQMSRIIAGIDPDEAMKPSANVATKTHSSPVPKAERGEVPVGTFTAAEPFALPPLPEMKVAPAIKTKEQRDAEREVAKEQKDKERALAKEQKDKEREAAKEATRKAKEDARAIQDAKKKESKAEKEARLMKAAEAGTEPIVTIADDDDGYDPLAGVGEPFLEDDDELTPEQLAALK